MKRRTLRVLSCAFCVALLPGLFQTESRASGASASAAYQRAARNVTGTVVGIGGRAAGRSRPFRLIINSYTTPSDVERLNSALRNGDDELLRALSELNAGRIQIGNGVGVPANAIIATPQAEGGTKLTVFFERNINLFELRYGARSADYRFGYAEIFLDSRGHGEGTFIGAARVRLRDGNTWEVEDFGVFPARIMGARATGTIPAR
jgi:hypothetical protein